VLVIWDVESLSFGSLKNHKPRCTVETVESGDRGRGLEKKTDDDRFVSFSSDCSLVCSAGVVMFFEGDSKKNYVLLGGSSQDL